MLFCTNGVIVRTLTVAQWRLGRKFSVICSNESTNCMLKPRSSAKTYQTQRGGASTPLSGVSTLRRSGSTEGASAFYFSLNHWNFLLNHWKQKWSPNRLKRCLLGNQVIIIVNLQSPSYDGENQHILLWFYFGSFFSSS